MSRLIFYHHSLFVGLRKSTFTTYFKLFIAFFVSGLIHETGDYALHQKWAGYSMKFFLLQAAAITCEDTIITLAIKAGFSSKPNRFVKFIGFAWVFAWFAYSLPLWVEKSFHEGAMNGLKYSLILGLWRGDWTPSRANSSAMLTR